ncbi:hypothetical protein H5410_019294, partial [Solanum commersonii]
VQQLIVTVPSGNYYEIDGDNGIRQLLYLVPEEFKVLNIYVVDEGEELIEVHNISQHSESYVETTEVRTDGESDNESDDNHVEVKYDSDDLNKIAFQKNRIIDETLLDYKELCIDMSFKDIPEARLCINLDALVNKRNLKQLKSDPSGLRAYFDTVCKNYEVVNNFTESMNKWILEARGKPIIKMLEEIRTKVMNQLRKKEDEVRFWAIEFSPKSMQLFNEYMKIAKKWKVNFNGDYGYEITEGCDRHTVNMILKRCTCRQWDLNGIPCPRAISAMLYNKLDPLSEMSWWYSNEAFLLTYRHKLQPIRSEIFWKVDPHQAMEPPDLVKMLVNTKPMKRTRKLIDEPEEINLTAPQPTQASQVVNFMSTPTLMHHAPQFSGLRTSIPSKMPDFELSETSKQRSSKPDATTLQHTVHPDLTINFLNHDPDLTIRPMVVSENAIFRARQEGPIPSGTRIINFVGDHNGVSVPSNLPFSPTNLTWKGKTAITQGQLEMQNRQKTKKLKPRKGQK